MEAKLTSVAEFLEERLPAHLFDRLEEASRGFSLPLFARDAESGQYECILGDIDSEETDERFIDAACAACELLSGADLDFVDDASVAPQRNERGEIVLDFRFDLSEQGIYDRFRRLLSDRDSRDSDIRATYHKSVWGYLVTVNVRFDSDFDYQRKKDSLDWMLQLARKKATNSPFSGRRL